MTNPSKATNIRSGRLTQPELRRVAVEHRRQADALLHELARRLLGRRPGALALAPQHEHVSEYALRVWPEAAAYLALRIQSRPEESPGRSPDMSVAAATAMRAVLAELSEERKGK